MKTKLFCRALALLLVMFCSGKAKAVENAGNVSADSVRVVVTMAEEQKDTKEVETVRPAKLTDEEKSIAEVLNGGFSMNLFKKYYVATGKQENPLLSPLSASYALSMLANGANGDNQKEILSVLGIGTADLEVLNSLNKKLTARLSNSRYSTTKIANGLWLDKGFKPRKPFAELMQSYYDAEVSALNLQKKGKAAINQWCSEKTNGKIMDVISDIPANTNFVLANALYFKGPWSSKFNEGKTAKAEFNNQDGTSAEVEFMNRTSHEKYFKNDMYSSVTLGFGGPYSIVFILPDEGVSLDECVNSFGKEPLASLSGNVEKKLNMKIPKFDMYGEVSLNGCLETLGMKKAFSPNADFSNITADYATLNNIITQKTSLKIGEKGAEGAAVTSIITITGYRKNNEKEEIVDFHLDRPFAYILFETDTNTILFMGAIKHLK